MSDYLEWMFGENLKALIDEHVDWKDESLESLDNPELSKGIEGAFEGPSVRMATVFHRVRIDDHNSRPSRRNALGDIYVASKGKSVRAIVTPDCDLVVRKGKAKVKQLLTMGGELRPFDQDSTSSDHLIFRNGKPYSLKWNPKDLLTFPIDGSGSLKEDPTYNHSGTLRPLYAQEMQRQPISDLGRVGLAVPPMMGVDVAINKWVRVKSDSGTSFQKLKIDADNIATVLLERGEAKNGHIVLLRRPFVHTLLDTLENFDQDTLKNDDKVRLSEFLKERNKESLLNGFIA